MIAIIKYNAGNISSVQNALTRLGYKSIITADESQILNADKVIFPGVGEASSAMKYLIEKGLDKTILAIKKPMLGICLGQQLMCEFTEEGNTDCLGIFNTQVKKFPKIEIVPHMGWNSFAKIGGELFKNIEPKANVYFVHSYYIDMVAEPEVMAVCEYGVNFAAA
ncbi:MAG: imidazole glycerol phosphate synthase subunit HisH, partial [Flavobacteriales bacterium]|nr:imidazole glycerol phosphate synthase subunit HisH [Flavobacteriales bacterium]